MAVTLMEERPVVTSVLVAGDSTARVLLSMAARAEQPFDPRVVQEWFPIVDATVRLVSGPDTVALVASTHSDENPCVAGPLYPDTPAATLLPGCYAGAITGGVQAGGTYDLIVDLADGGRIEGRTTVPTSPTVIQPAAGAAVPIGTRESGAPPAAVVEWMPVPSMSVVELRTASQDPSCSMFLTSPGGIAMTEWLTVIGDSTAEIRIRANCSTFGSGLPGDIIATTFDSSYTRYTSAIRNTHRLPDAAAGFTGPAIGVFGSAAMVRQPVQFVQQ